MNLRCVALLIFTASFASAHPVRTWVPAGGGPGTDAAFLLEKDGCVGLQTAEGGKMRVPLDKLCAIDQAYVTLLRQPSGSGIPPELEAMFGAELVDADGRPVSFSVLSGGKIGIYFSASWCPPCRAFTPKLVEAYQALGKKGLPFEIVFAPRDATAEKSAAYMKDHGMTWPALPFGSGKIEALAEKYTVRGIPTLVVVDDAGKTLTRDGRMDVATDGADAYPDW